MDYKLRKQSRPLIRKPTVPKKKLVKMLELRDWKIRGQGCLLSLLTLYANTDIRPLYHADIVPSVADPSCDLVCIFANAFRNLSLLCGRASATDHRLCLSWYFKEKFLLLERSCKADAINNKNLVRLRVKLLQSLLELLFVGNISNFENLLAGRFDSRWNCDANCCFHFISCKHPYIYSCLSYILQGLADVFLQFILHPSDA